ncbi:MAG: hypothetical protein JW820_12815 [Spirochaetales bacterium]|nr:hypothetical protein [Spirochaetales bacterium]
MGMFYLFPFGILVPALLIFLLLRFGSRIFGEFFRSVDGRRPQGGWLSGDASRQREVPTTFGSVRRQNLEARIFRLAFKRKGRITVSDVVLETGLGIKESEEAVNAMVDGIRVRMEVDDRGLVVYEFPEIMARFEGR